MNSPFIRPYPMPDGIKNSILRRNSARRLAIFAGAGCSRICGCSSWAEMAAKLIDACRNDDHQLIDYRVKRYLSDESDKKKVITICKNILPDNVFWETVEKSLKHNPKKLEKFNIYNRLRDLNHKGLFLTTNIDNLFAEAYKGSPNVFYNLQENHNPQNDSLYYIHGCIGQNRDDVVLTVDQYLSCYRREGRFNTFLTTVFRDYSVLFIGYGLEEFEILDFLLTSVGGDVADLPHYILLPFYSGEEDVITAMGKYYKELGIRVIPYVLDDNGYEEMSHVIEDWYADLKSTEAANSDYDIINHPFEVSEEILESLDG